MAVLVEEGLMSKRFSVHAWGHETKPDICGEFDVLPDLDGYSMQQIALLHTEEVNAIMRNLYGSVGL